MKTLFILGLVLTTFSTSACEQRGIIKSVSSNKNFIQFKLDSGFTISLAQKSPLVPILFMATGSKDEICATHFEANTKINNSGSPRQLTINKY